MLLPDALANKVNFNTDRRLCNGAVSGTLSRSKLCMLLSYLNMVSTAPVAMVRLEEGFNVSD
jgi:hypothetical protein